MENILMGILKLRSKSMNLTLKINGYEAVSLIKMEIKYRNYVYVSSSDCITIGTSSSKQLCSAVPISRSSIVGSGIPEFII